MVILTEKGWRAEGAPTWEAILNTQARMGLYGPEDGDSVACAVRDALAVLPEGSWAEITPLKEQPPGTVY